MKSANLGARSGLMLLINQGRAVLLGVIALLAVFPPSACADVQIMTITNVWRYEQSNNLDGISWQAPAFDDSGWPSGNALLYVESSFLVSPRNTPLTLGRTTYYFRSPLVLPYASSNVWLIFNARIDDGAVFYLNGQEIQRVRMPAAPTAISYTNLATGTPSPSGDARVDDIFTLAGTSITNLVMGTNLLAVEVHQQLANSDDIVFGTAVTVKFTNTPPIVHQHPADLAVLDGRPTSLTAVIDGDPLPALQWFKNGSPVPGATNATLSFANTYPWDEGSYWLSATNVFGGLLTSNATVTVLTDTNPPTVIAALAQKNMTNVSLTFSEALLTGTATNPANFEIFQSIVPTNRLEIVSAQLTAESNLVLQTSARTPGLHYSVRVNGLSDMASVSNVIAADSVPPLTYQVDLVTIDAQTQWRYFQGGSLPATNWMQPEFDDSTWPSGAAMFQAGLPLPLAPEPVRTPLLLSTNSASITTYYFRTQFRPPGPVVTSNAGLRHIVDDGVVFYLNGSEIFSLGTSLARPLSYASAATRSINAANYEPPLSAAARPVSGASLLDTTNFFAAEVHQWFTGYSDVAFAASLEGVIAYYYPQLQWAAPPTLTEGTGTLTNQAWLSIPEPQATNLVIHLSSSQPGDLSVPPEIVLPAGSTNIAIPLSLGDDAFFNGPRAVTLTAQTAAGMTASSTLQVLDDEINLLSLLVAVVTSETNGTLAAEVRLTQPVTGNINVSLASSDLTELVVPASVVIPNGATSAVFQVTVLDDALLDGPQTVTLSASVTGWPIGLASVTVEDNEAATLTLQVPSSVVEGGGVLTNAGKVQVGGLAVSNLVVTLTTTSPELFVVPANVTIFQGQSNALFNLTLQDNSVPEPSRTVGITAQIVGITAASNSLVVLDDDVHHFRFSFVASPQYSNATFSLSVWAENLEGISVTNFRQSITLAADAVDGPRLVEPSTIGPFSNGKWTGSLRVTVPGKRVKLSCPLASGESYPFNVEPPAAWMLSQPVNDVAYDPVSGAVLATVSSAGPYENQLVVIDPRTATITNSYNIGPIPGQIEVSPTGQFIYVGLSNNYFLRRFDLVTHSLGPIINLTKPGDPATYASDFVVVGGMADSVVATVRDYSVWDLMRRYDSGSPTDIVVTPQHYLSQLTASPTGAVVYAWDSVWPTPYIDRINVNPPALEHWTNINFSGVGRSFAFSEGALYSESGQVLDANTLALRGQYQSGGAFCVDPAIGRTWFVDYPNYTNVKIKAFDRDSFGFITAVAMPPVTGVPQRLLRWGTNGLAFCSQFNQAWFVRSDLLVPTGMPADVRLKFLPPVTPVLMGSNVTYTLIVTNAGPGSASLLRLTNALPAAVAGLSTSASTGLVTNSTNGFVWFIPELSSGASATLQYTLAHTIPGWNNHTAFVLADEADPVWTNNAAAVESYVQLPGDYSGAIGVNLPVSDLCYDASSDRLLLALGNTGNSQSNGIAVFDPYTGLVDTFVPLGEQPGKLARSENGQYLYVSLPAAARVCQLDLSSFSVVREFGLGSELINGTDYPFYAADMAAVPGVPDSLVVWRVRRAGPLAGEYGRGIALVQSGIVATNVTASGGNWAIEFDQNTGELFGINASTVQRFILEASGVSLAENYPSLNYYDPAANFEYAHERMWLTRGRVLRASPFGITGICSGSENASQVEPDAAGGRAYYLTLANSLATLRAYDMNNLALINSLVVSNLPGTAGPLIRWGTNGLAFTTSNNKLVLVRGPLVLPLPGADLALELVGPSSVPASSNLTYVFTVTNNGPETADAVRLTNRLSGGAAILSVTNTVGTWTTNATQLVWSLGSLGSSSNAAITVFARAPTSGTVTMAADLQAGTLDPDPGNNSVVHWSQVDAPGSNGLVQALTLACNDLVWDPIGNRILATVSNSVPNWGNGLVSIVPETRTVVYETFVGTGAGRLALADDGSRLYVGVDYAVQPITLSTMAPTARFPLDPGGGVYSLRDLAVMPGAPSNVVALTSGFLGLYQGGVRGTNTVSLTGQAVSFGTTPAQLHVLRSGTFYAGYMEISRLTADANGITLQQTLPGFGPWGADADLHTAGGRLYTSPGYVLNPDSLELLGAFPYIPSASLMLPTAELGRILYLIPEGGGWTLAAFDTQTRQRIGSMPLAGVSGKPTDLIRWGAQGVAFRTSSNQVFLVQTTLLPTNPPADLAVTVSTSGNQIVASNLVQTLTISNAGPYLATNVTWTCTLPANATVLGANVSQGTLNTNSTSIQGVLPQLAASSTMTAVITFTCSSAGLFAASASVQSESLDTNAANDHVGTILWIHPAGGPGEGLLNFAVKDMVRDPLQPRLYASLGTNAGAASSRIVAVDPVSGVVGEPRFIGNDPGRMAVSADGQFLYVGLDAEGMVQRVHLPSLLPDLRFAVTNAWTVTDMGVDPTNSSLAFVRPKYGGKIQFFENGVPRGTELSGLDVLAFSDVTSELYGCNGLYSGVPLWRIDVGPQGPVIVDSQPGKPSGTIEMKFAGGLLHYDRGMVVDPVSRRVKGVLPLPYNSLIEPDPKTGRIYALTPSGSWFLRAYDSQQFIQTTATNLSGIVGTPRRLTRWGTNGFAFFTPTQLYISRAPLVPAATLADLGLAGNTSVSTLPVGAVIQYNLRLTNMGPFTATGIVLTQQFSLSVTGLQASASQGSVNIASAPSEWKVGDLGAGAVATLTVTGQPAQEGTLVLRATASHAGNDPALGNNALLLTARVGQTTPTNQLIVSLATRELVYDASRDRIYASIPAVEPFLGNSVAVINPATASVERSMFVGSEPNQLAMSDDAHYLYATLNGTMGVCRLDLQGNSPNSEFELGPDDMYNAFDLKVAPAHPETIAVSRVSLNTSGDYPRDVSLYDSGVRRPQAGRATKTLDFSSDASWLFGYVTPGTGFGYLRMPLDSSGVVTNDVFTSYQYDFVEVKYNNGRLYTYIGQVLEPNLPMDLGTIASSGPFTVDDICGRIFYLTQSGTNWMLRAHDINGFQLVATQLVAGVKGTPGGLIRCGADRLAFRTSSDQLVIVKTPLVPTNVVPSANLAVMQTAFQDVSNGTETLRFNIIVTNRGSGTASNVLLTIMPPSPNACSALVLPQGTSTNTVGNYLCNLDTLPAGQQLEMVLSVVITNTASYTNLVTVSSSSPDPDLADNVSSASLQGLFFQRTDSVRAVSASARDLAFDLAGRRLYASVSDTNPVGRVICIAPETAVIESEIPVAANPRFLALSDDFRYLHVSFLNTNLIQRINLLTRVVDFEFNLPTALPVSALLGLPGQPDTIAVTCRENFVGVFDHGVVRSNTLAHGFYLLTTAENGQTLFGYDYSTHGGESPDMFELPVTPNGVQYGSIGPSDTPWGADVDMDYAGGRLYFGRGWVFNPNGWVEESAFPSQSSIQEVEINLAANRATFLQGDYYSPPAAITVFDLATRQQLASISAPGRRGGSSLTQCGADRLAFCSGNEIVLMRSSAIPTADVQVWGTLSTNSCYAGETVTVSLILSNSGSQSASGLTLTNTLPAQTRLLSAVFSQGTMETNGNKLLASPGILTNGAFATLTLQLQPTNGLARLLTNFAEINSGALPDPLPANNRWIGAFASVADADRDGLPDDWELARGLNPTNAMDATIDSDCDGRSNLQEYLAGTDPFRFEPLRLTQPRMNPQGDFELTLEAAVGKAYTLEASTNLLQWSVVRTFVCLSSNETIVIPRDSASPGSFFRLQTDLAVALPLLRLLNVPDIATNRTVLEAVAPPGRTYSLQSSSNLVDWVNVTNYFGLDCSTVIEDTGSAPQTRFYRLVAP